MTTTFNPTSLTGPNAFYQSPDYETKTRGELTSTKPLKPIYETNLENKAWRITKLVFSIIIFPIGLCKLIHRLVGKLIVPSSSPILTKMDAQTLSSLRSSLDLSRNWKYKRISVEVDGHTIDAMIMGKEATLGNGRWTIGSVGNGMYYEQIIGDSYGTFKSVLKKTNSNAIVFNYPGVGSSSGLPSRNGMAKAYRAILKFLEDKEKGIGAKEIIGYGHSIGAGVQAEALKNHSLKDDVKYVFIKDRTFSSISAVPGGFFGFLAKVFGWNMDCTHSSLKLKAPEIIIQTAAQPSIEGNPELIQDDQVITHKASLAKKLLEKRANFAGPKQFLGVREAHNDALNDSTIKRIAEKVNYFFDTYPQPKGAPAAEAQNQPLPAPKLAEVVG